MTKLLPKASNVLSAATKGQSRFSRHGRGSRERVLDPFCTVPRIHKPRAGPPYRIRRGPRTRCQLRSVSGAAADMVLIPQSGHRPGLVRVTVSDHRALPIRARGALPQDGQIANR
jgi:hypothetical protein